LAVLISKATGNWTTNTTWAIASEVANALVDAEVTNSTVGTGTSDSTSFVLAAAAVDRVGVRINGNTASAGTLTISLRNSTNPGTNDFSVTVNVSDIPVNGWFFVKAGSPVTPNGTDSYIVRLQRSTTGGTLTVNTNSGIAAMSRVVGLTTDNTPASGDKIIVVGEHTGAGTGNSFTVTMNETATTSYGPTWVSDTSTPGGIYVGKRGTLTWGTTSSTNYYLKWKGRFNVNDQGTVNVGTSGTRIPSNSTAVLEMDSVVNVDSGIYVRPGGTMNIYGHNGRTTTMTLLNTDEAISSTVLGVSDTTGWQTNDELAIAATSRTPSECEKVTISTVDSSTQVTINSGLAAAHSGTSPIQAEVINLTRNVKIRGVSSSLQGYLRFDTTSIVAVDYVEFLQLGSSTTSKRGIDIDTSTGSCSITNSSVHDSTVSSSQGFTISSAAANNITLQYNVLYNISGTMVSTSASITNTNIILDNIWAIRSVVGTNFIFNDLDITMTNLRAVGAPIGSGFSFTETSGAGVGTISNIQAHSNASNGITIGAAFSDQAQIISNIKSWRNVGAAVSFTVAANLVINTLEAFGNGRSLDFGSGSNDTVIINDATLNGDTSFGTVSGIGTQATGAGFNVIFNRLDASNVTGIKVAHSSGDIFISTAMHPRVILRDSILRSSAEIVNQSLMAIGAYISSQRHDQTAGSHKTWCKTGTVTIETTTYRTASPSMKLTPTSSTLKLDTAARVPRRGMLYRVSNGGTISPTVYVQKDGTYNGNAPRLILKANHALGVLTDQVLDTLSVGANTWEQLTGTSPTATDDGVFEVVVDCDGTAGNIFVDDWGPGVGNAVKYWHDGLPSQDIFTGGGSIKGVLSSGGNL
jgi:hypothetical protein